MQGKERYWFGQEKESQVEVAQPFCDNGKIPGVEVFGVRK